MAKKHKHNKLLRFHHTVKHHLHLALIPHKANDYRPHLVRSYGIIIILGLIVGLQLLYNGVKTGNVLGQQSQITTAGLLADTNKERAKQNEAPLALNQQLTRAAELKVQDMYTHQYWDHTSPSGVTPWAWFAKVGYSYSDAGENLAKNFYTSDAVSGAWIASPTHRANILKSAYSDVGFATMDGQLDGKPTTLVVAMYGTPAYGAVTASAKVQPITTVQTSDIHTKLNLATRFGVALQSLTPAAVASIIILLVAVIVALAAHSCRDRLPKQWRKSWKRHYGLYKAIGFSCVAVAVVLFYGVSAQI